MSNKKKKEKKVPNKTSYYIYILAAAYLIYIDYSVLSTWGNIKSNERIVVAMVVAVFALFAGWLLTHSVKGLMAMRNDSNKKD